MMPVSLLDLELDDWLDPSVPSNLFMLGSDELTEGLNAPTAAPPRAHIVFVPPTPASPINVVEPEYNVEFEA